MTIVSAPNRPAPSPLLVLRAVGTLAALAAFLTLQLGAGVPEVITVRVPSAKVDAWFPPGTQLRGTSAKELTALIEAAKAGERVRAAQRPPRVLRTSHFARWDAGVLIGRSELVVEPPGSSPGLLPLSPWSPAVNPGEADSGRLRMLDDGGTAVWVEASTSTITLNWELRARPNSSGRGFSLGLPATEAASLVLDLPDGWTPEGPGGIRQGPEPSATEGRKRWQFDGKGGLINLRLRDPASNRDASREPQPWVSGTTRIEVRGASAAWSTSWTVNVDPQGPRRIQVELDPGLELLDVNGPAVAESRAEAVGAVTRVSVRFNDQVSGPTPLQLRALARVPGEGAWTIPALRPLDAAWTGGLTILKLDATRVLADCREGAGRRVAPRPGDSADENAIVFEATAPRPVATLVFSKPRVDASVDVRGQLFLGNAAPRIKCRLSWSTVRGHLLALDVDLPPAWVPEGVQIEGIDAAPAWHPETLPGGEVRVHVQPPSGDLARDPLVLNVIATASIGGGRGPLSLPRVRPVGVRVSDERWVAWTEAGLTLQPTAARGLAWIDPALAAERPEAESGMHEALAWRWVDDRAEAKVDRERAQTDPTGSVRMIATVDRDHLRLDWRITANHPEESIRSLTVVVSEPIAGLRDWRFTDEATGLEVARRPLAAEARTALGFPETGEAWELVLPRPGAGPVAIRSRLTIPRHDFERIPLLTLPSRFRGRNLAVIEVARDVLSSVEPMGLDRLDPRISAEALEPAGERDEEDTLDLGPSPYRPAHAFGYTRPGGRLALRTEGLIPARNEGVIDEAILTTFVDRVGPRRHRLTLRVAADGARSLDLAMPDRATVLRVRRDGQEVSPVRADSAISIPLPAAAPKRSTCTITLEYITPPRHSGRELLLRPERPKSSLPYLDFSWKVIAPEPWELASYEPGLIATDPVPSTSWARRFLGRWRSPWGFERNPSSKRDEAMLRDLDRRVARAHVEEIALGEWFTRWDALPWPLLVDGMALESAGLGPRSRVIPRHSETPGTGAARDALRPLGLTVVPIGNSLLITTASEAPTAPGQAQRPDAPGALWPARLREAAAWGSDVSGRFQSIGRWRGEATPKLAPNGDSTDLEPIGEGWRAWRFSASGWPEGTEVRLRDERAGTAWEWVATFAVLALGVAARGLTPQLRAAALSTLLISSVIGVVRDVPLAPGACIGGLAVFFYWIGCSLRGTDRSRASTSHLSGRTRVAGAGVVPLAIAGIALASLLDPSRSARGQAGAGQQPIIVLLPYDGAPDPKAEPDRAILKLADYERLQALARSGQGGPPSSLAARDATYRITGGGDREAIVDSQYELIAAGDGSTTWTIPVGSARNVTANLDDQSVPVLIRRGKAVVSIPTPGRHKLTIRRTIVLRRDGDDASLELPIPPMAAARVVVEGLPRDRRVVLATARGRVSAGEGLVSGALGPADHLEVRWHPAQGGERPARAGTVEGLLLWDAEPSGDRLRARLTYRNPAGTSVIRLRVAPDLLIRPGSIPGLVDVTRQGTAEAPEWVASMEPPLPDGASIQLECWRPLASPKLEPGPHSRILPRIEPLGVESYLGAFGFRRPADWSGRLGGTLGGEPLTEEAFVRSWGNLPEEPLTLSGVTRFLRAPDPNFSLLTGPQPGRFLVQPNVQLAVEPGRVAIDLKADLTEASGRVDHLALDVPEALRVVRIDGGGLTDWTRGAGRIQLRFDGASARQRSIRIQGWLPVLSDPMSTVPGRLESPIVWPRWIDAETSPGTLTLQGPAPIEIESRTGINPLPAAASASAPSGTALSSRKSYRVDLLDGLGKMRWAVEPPRVSVQVRSHLTLQPDSAEWVAVLRYDVSGGAWDAFHLKLPTEWASVAEVEVAGNPHPSLTSVTKGKDTFWTIRPDHPIWGSRRLIIRSVRTITDAETVTFPDLNPLGRGSVDTYLAIANASGRDLTTEGSPGLQPIDDQSRFLDEVFAGQHAPADSVFHVRAGTWSLTVGPPHEAKTAAATATAEGQSRVALAVIDCNLRPDGLVLGSARYEVESHPGRFLPVVLPAGSEPLWATVNRSPSRPMLASSGRWLIPLKEEVVNEVTLVWQSVIGRDSPLRAWRVPLPALAEGRVPTLVTLNAPHSGTVTSPTRALVSIPLGLIEAEEGEWLRRSTAETLTRIDRGSLHDRAALVSALVRVELTLRGSERAAEWDPSRATSSRDEWTRRLAERIQSVRSGLQESIEIAGLDEFAREARVHLGQEAEVSGTPTVEIPEPASMVRVRRLGKPYQFREDTSDNGPRPSLLWSPKTPAQTAGAWETWQLLPTLAVIPLLVWGLVGRQSRGGRLTLVASSVAMVAIAVVAGPFAVVVVLTLTALGRFS